MDTPLLFLIFYFFLGAIVGSFLNVIIFRYNTKTPITLGRSYCFACGKTLLWFELLPIVSYLLLRGRCRFCKTRLSLQYPAVESLTGLVFVLSALEGYGTGGLLFMWVISSVLLTVTVYDIRHKIIPDGLVYFFVILSFVQLFFNFSTITLQAPTLWNFVAGPLLSTPFLLAWFLSQGAWIGLGDAKLVLGVGWLLGIMGGLSALIIAFWSGAVLSLLFLFVTRIVHRYQLLPSVNTYTMKSEIPFAPFITFGFFVVLFFEINLLTVTFF